MYPIRHVESSHRPIYLGRPPGQSTRTDRLNSEAVQWEQPAQPPAGAQAKWPVVLPADPPIRVLLADDNRSSRHLLHTLLTRWGMDVECAVDGLDAWEALHRVPFEMVVSDIEMPRWSGNQLVASMRKSLVPSLRNMPVILVSSLSPEAVVREFSHWNGLYFIQRPIELAELVDMLRLATGRS